MSVYSAKGKGWRYDFTRNNQRYTEAWFKTKREAMAAEAKKREELESPQPEPEPRQEEVVIEAEPPTVTTFLDLVNLRMDYVEAYCSADHYQDYFYLGRRWVRRWGKLPCGEITQAMAQRFVLERSRVSPFTANKEIRYLRATFNFGKKKGLVESNPMDGIEFLPTEKRIRYVPPAADIDKVIALADPDTQDYLCVLRDTLARVSEINNLKWEDVNLKERYLFLYTRKKKGGHLTPRKIFMTDTLFAILSRRYSSRDKSKPWVFWHSYRNKDGETVEGPYLDRKKFMRTLCKKAKVRYFRFHALRHSGASIMDSNSVPIGAIQKILGHENRSTTEIYLHSIGESERQVYVVAQNEQNGHTKRAISQGV